jgi:threonine synthase
MRQLRNRAVRESSGTAVAVSDDEMIAARAMIAAEGIQACLEGSATAAAL